MPLIKSNHLARIPNKVLFFSTVDYFVNLKIAVKDNYEISG